MRSREKYAKGSVYLEQWDKSDKYREKNVNGRVVLFENLFR